MSTPASLLAKVLITSFALGACGGGGGSASGAANTFALSLRATSDDGKTIPGVAFRAPDRVLGVTDDAGVATARVRGVEGQTVRVQVSCPEGFAAREPLAPLRLTETRPLAAAHPAPIPYEATCARTVRDVVIVVAARNGAALPIAVNGEFRTATDDEGHAHIFLRVPQDTRSIEVRLDTTRHPQLKPTSPVRTFELSGRDALALFEQHFRLPPKTTTRNRASRPRAHVPERLQ